MREGMLLMHYIYIYLYRSGEIYSDVVHPAKNADIIARRERALRTR